MACRLLYSGFDLRTASRRVMNSKLTEAHLHNMRQRFNDAFHDVYRSKAATADKIAEQNARLVEVSEELARMGAPLKPEDATPLIVRTHVEEIGEGAMGVTDSEVGIAQYVSAADRETAAQAATEERAREADAAKGCIYDRAIEQMGGLLANKGAAAEIWELEKPNWMLGDAAGWNEEQHKLAASFAAEQKKLTEEKDKHRSSLEAEVRNPHCWCSTRPP